MFGNRWVVLREGQQRRWGGDLRRAYLLDGLADRTGAALVDNWRIGPLTNALRKHRGHRWELWRSRAHVASPELLRPASLEAIGRFGRAAVVDIHDHPLAQLRAFGIPPSPEREVELRGLLDANLAAFRWYIVQSGSFVKLAGLDPARTIVAPNGTDTAHVTRHPLPLAPVVGFVSGAAAGRGIETLIEAVRLARTEISGLTLRLWLVATGDESREYLERLTAASAAEPWIAIGEAPYAALDAALATASILAVPHPANDYMDTVLPIKLFDSMAAGRPLVVTPRVEMAEVVQRHQAGLVARGDKPADLAEAISRLAGDQGLAERLGANARVAAEREFDWRIIGARLADALLARTSPWWTPARRRRRVRG